MMVDSAYRFTVKDKRKILGYKDLASAVTETEQFDFLIDIIPERARAATETAAAADDEGPEAKKQKIEEAVDGDVSNGTGCVLPVALQRRNPVAAY